MQIILWKKYVENNPNDEFSTVLPNNINSFGIRYIDEFWDTYREQLSFNSTYKEDASIIIDKLKNDGHELCIVTSRPDDRYENLKEKITTALKENNIHIDTIHTNARDKGSYCKEHNFDLLIDDNIKQIQSAKNNGLKGILFNEIKDYEGLQTNNWKDLYNIIKEL